MARVGVPVAWLSYGGWLHDPYCIDGELYWLTLLPNCRIMVPMIRGKATRPINPNSFAYFMGFNSFRLNRTKNPFNRNTQYEAAKDWLHGFVDASNLKAKAAA